MTMTLDGTSGITTPGVVNTAGETIATTLAVTGASTLTGNVGIGTASPNKQSITKALTINGSGYNGVELAISDTLTADFITNASAAYLSTRTSIPLVFQTNGTEQARIDSAGLLKFNSGYGSAATAYGCRAWVNFNGTGTVAISASGNVSSITDNGVGDYSMNFTTAIVDASYAVCGSARNGSVDNGYYVSNELPQNTTASARLFVINHLGSLVDGRGISATAFR